MLKPLSIPEFLELTASIFMPQQNPLMLSGHLAATYLEHIRFIVLRG